MGYKRERTFPSGGVSETGMACGDGSGKEAILGKKWAAQEEIKSTGRKRERHARKRPRQY